MSSLMKAMGGNALSATYAPGDFQVLGHIFKQRLSPDSEPMPAGEREVIKRARLIRGFIGLVQQLSSLMVGRGAASGRGFSGVFNDLMDIITETLDAERSTLFLFDAESKELYSTVTVGGLSQELRISANSGVGGSVFRSGRPLFISDAYRDPLFSREMDRRTGFRTHSILCAPLRNWDNQIIGVAQVLNKRRGSFTEEDLALLEVLTSQAAGALQSMQLNQDVQKELEDEAQLLGITTDLSTELKLDILLKKIISIASGMLEADRGTLLLHDKATGELRSIIADGLDGGEIRIPMDKGIAGAVFQSGQVIKLDHAYNDPRFNRDVDQVTGYSTESLLCVPVITSEAETLGIIQLLNKAEGGAFSPRDQGRLEALAAQAAIAIRNARLFEAVLNARNYSESILGSLSNGVVTLDQSSRVTKFNPAAARILGLAAGERDGALQRILLSETNAWIPQTLAKVGHSRLAQVVADASIHVSAEHSVSVNLTVEPLIDAQGQFIGSILILEDISREKRIKGTMSRYMSHELTERLLDVNQSLLGGQAQEVTVLFSDIRGFTEMAERLGPQSTVTMLNDYFSEMAEVVFQHQGILDKYIGDGLMVLFGTPFPGPEDADNALRSAVDMLRCLDRFNRRRREQGREAISIRIGMSSGEVIAGNIGSPRRMDYTVVGHTVNLASRVEQACRTYGERILLTETTRRSLQGNYRLREIDRVRVKGSSEPLTLYGVLEPDLMHECADIGGLQQAFGHGLHLYRVGHWPAAEAAFRQALDIWPHDRAAAVFSGRCARYAESPPEPDWDGAWDLVNK